jgi:hypothetical protein
MSALLLPLVAAGGIYLAVDALTQKNRISSDSKSNSLPTTQSKPGSESEDPIPLSTQAAPLDQKKKRRSLANQKPENLFALKNVQARTRKHREKKTRKLFVFYSFGEKNKDWDYQSLPSTWKMKRRVLNANRTTNYNNVDLFQGGKVYQGKMSDYLEKAFSQLKATGIVKEYKIRGIDTP